MILTKGIMVVSANNWNFIQPTNTISPIICPFVEENDKLFQLPNNLEK